MNQIKQSVDKDDKNVDLTIASQPYVSEGISMGAKLNEEENNSTTMMRQPNNAQKVDSMPVRADELSDTATGNGAAKKLDPTTTSQTNVQSQNIGMGDGLTKAVIGGVVGVVVGTLAAALTNKKTAQSINSAVKDTRDAVKVIARGVAKSVRDTVKGAGDALKVTNENVKSSVEGAGEALKATSENVKSSVEGAVERVKDTVEDAQQSVAQSIKLYEERLVADTKPVKTASVSIGKHVETQIAHISVPVRKERLVIEQTTPLDAGTPVTPGEAVFYEGEIARLEIYEERADVQKQAFVREEFSVHKEVDRDTVEVEDTIRREELYLDNQGSNDIDKTEIL